VWFDLTNCPRLFGPRYQDETRGRLGADWVEVSLRAGRLWVEIEEIVVVLEFFGDYIKHVENHFGGAGRRSLVLGVLVRAGSRFEGSREGFGGKVELLHQW